MKRFSRTSAGVGLALLLSAAIVGCSARGGSGPSTSGSATPGGRNTTVTGQSLSTQSASASTPATPVVFAVIGDYGTGGTDEKKVARLVASWKPAFVITTGDDYYRQAGGKGLGRYRNSTGRFYYRWLPGGAAAPGGGGSHGAPTNSFYPTPGNHDYSDTGGGGLRTYLAYFDLPGDGRRSTSGNERYYDFVRGPIHFFALNSNPDEPSGIGKTSLQAIWLRRNLAASREAWQIVYDHHPPYSSDRTHGSTRSLQWPFAQWGADAVLSGHAHTYERVERNGIVYFVNGTGGARLYGFGTPVTGSKVRYSSQWGAQRVVATSTEIVFEFYTAEGHLIDRYRLSK